MNRHAKNHQRMVVIFSAREKLARFKAALALARSNNQTLVKTKLSRLLLDECETEGQTTALSFANERAFADRLTKVVHSLDLKISQTRKEVRLENSKHQLAKSQLEKSRYRRLKSQASGERKRMDAVGLLAAASRSNFLGEASRNLP